jgi:anti-anti-sigma factor
MADAEGVPVRAGETRGVHVGLAGGELVLVDEHGIGGVTFDQGGEEAICAVSVITVGDVSKGVPFTLRVHGEVDIFTIPFVRERLRRAIALPQARDLVLDFTYCDYIDSSGLALLLVVRNQLARSGGRLRVSNATPSIRRKLARTLSQGIVDDSPAGAEIPPDVSDAANKGSRRT